MKHYKCTGKTEWDTLCECEYREVKTGSWEYRYQGEEEYPPAPRGWKPIDARTIDEIESYGHTLAVIGD